MNHPVAGRATPGARTSADADSVSVVIPAFDAERYVREAIDSVLSQQPAPIEVIVVDDGSTDGTAAAVASFGQAVTLLSKPNGGEASARNAGLRAASGTWVAFLDADDRFLDGRLAAFADHVRTHPTSDLVTADAYITADGAVVATAYGRHWTFPATDHRTEILRRNFVLGHVVVRRERLVDIGGFDETITHCTDWDAWIRLLHDGGEIGWIDRPLSIYRAHATSMSADVVAMATGRLDVLDRAARLPLDASDRAVLEAQRDVEELRLASARLTAALLDDSADPRRPAVDLLCRPGTPLRSRTRGLVSAVAPGLVSRVERRRRGGASMGTMGLNVDGDSVEANPTPQTGPSPLVSVVLPFLNELAHLEEAIETVTGQTFTDWELLLVDDGSTDGSGDIADRAAGADARIRVLRHAGGLNRGLPASRNLGLGAASAGLLASLDADDRWLADKLRRQVDTMAADPSLAFTCGPTRWCFADGRPDEIVPVLDDAPRRTAPGEFARLTVLERLGPPPPSNVMYRTAALRRVGGVPDGDMFYEDQRTFVAISLDSPVHVTDHVLSTYAVRSDSIYGSTDDHDRRANRRVFVRWSLAHALRRGPRGVVVAGRIAIGLVVRRIPFRIRSRFRRLILRLRPD